jgi:acyl-CoA synthetase (AMP-forming)/AMP-acid ligase II
MTVADFVTRLAARHGDREAVVGPDRRLTYHELDAESRRWARGLLARGVGKGTRVGLWLGNGADWVMIWAALARIGAVPVPLSTFFKERELAEVARHADLQGVICHHSFLGEHMLLRLGGAFPELHRRAAPESGFAPLRAAPFLRWIVALGADAEDLPGWASPASWVTSAASDPGFDDDLLAEVAAEVHPTDVGLMIYTSGSTAAPKGVPHTHETVMAKTHHLRDMLGIDGSTRSYTASPFFWVGGLTMSLLPVLAAGGTQVCTDRFDAGEVLRLIEVERITRAVLYPHHLDAMLGHPDLGRYDRSSLRDADPRLQVGSAAADTAVPPPDALHIGLGMTETFGGYWWGRFDADPTPRARAGARALALRPGERRTPPLDVMQPGVELKVVDDAGRPVADGERGEILIRGTCLTPGLHKLARAAQFDADGFYRTGDEGEVDGRRVHFRGRLGAMIKTAGANVAPDEVADALRTLDGVAEAYVVGLPDAVRGQVVAAAVVPRPGVSLDAERLRAALHERLSAFKVPVHIVFLAEDEVPWTASHKVRVSALAQLIEGRVNRSDPLSSTVH